jgi:3-deoxy-D-manno-octulosonic-acid transferase
MEGEEAAALAAYRAARLQHPSLRLVLVPRHAERFDSLAAWLVESGESVVRRSRISQVGATAQPSVGPPPIILIDTIGELASVWGLADVAFVGGSLLPGRGGQNMMEPAAYGASVIFGPHTSNFRETVEQLLARKAACRVADADELKLRLLQDLDDPEAATARGEAGRAFVLAQHGASGRTLAELDRLVEGSLAQKSA